MNRFYKAEHFWQLVITSATAIIMLWAECRYLSGLFTGFAIFWLADIAGEIWPKYMKRTLGP